MKYNHSELKNIALDENKFPMLCYMLDLLCTGFLRILNSSNKRRIRAAALINFFVPNAALMRGRRLLNFFVPNAALIRGRRLIGGGAYSSKYGIFNNI